MVCLKDIYVTHGHVFSPIYKLNKALQYKIQDHQDQPTQKNNRENATAYYDRRVAVEVFFMVDAHTLHGIFWLVGTLLSSHSIMSS